MPDVLTHQVKPHANQAQIKSSQAKRKIVRAGRRSGKTVVVADIAVDYFLDGHRVLYATPTGDQITRFWYEIVTSLREPIDKGVFYKNETEHIVELPHTLQRIRAKTAWNAETLRGDYGDLLILDEFQLMNEDTWGVVGAPMLLDNNGDAIIVYTPPSIKTAGISRAHDTRYASRLFKEWQKKQGAGNKRYAVFSFTSHDNPFISKEALEEIVQDMTALAYEQEILAQDKEDNPAALFKRKDIEDHRWEFSRPAFEQIVVGVDPSTAKGGTGDECGIIVGARAKGEKRKHSDQHLFVLEDASMRGSPDEWAKAAIAVYRNWEANVMVMEDNQGGEMNRIIVRQIDPEVRVELVRALHSKEIRADEIVPIYEDGRGHHVGKFPLLEDEMCQWQHGSPSPNRLDAHVHAAKKLMLRGKSGVSFIDSEVKKESAHELA